MSYFDDTHEWMNVESPKICKGCVNQLKKSNTGEWCRKCQDFVVHKKVTKKRGYYGGVS